MPCDAMRCFMMPFDPMRCDATRCDAMRWDAISQDQEWTQRTRFRNGPFVSKTSALVSESGVLFPKRVCCFQNGCGVSIVNMTACLLVDWLAGWLSVCLPSRLAVYLAGLLAGWDRLASDLAGELAGSANISLIYSKSLSYVLFFNFPFAKEFVCRLRKMSNPCRKSRATQKLNMNRKLKINCTQMKAILILNSKENSCQLHEHFHSRSLYFQKN